MKTQFSKDIVLASQSPRRRDILTNMGLDFTICPADVDESQISALTPSLLVKRLAVAKASAVEQQNTGKTIISADTVVYRKGIYGKPSDRAHAIKMLTALSNKWHSVYTGVCVTCNKQAVVFFVKSRVKFKKLTQEQIEKYVDECNPLDKAGAYGIQDEQIVEKYKGSYTNIVGLPQEKLAKVLGKVGVIDGNN